MEFIKKHYPSIISILFLLAMTGTAMWFSGRLTGHHFSYPLDDTYIHMAVSGNLAKHGVWGINADQYAAASSSPLYTLLLAAMFKIGWTSITMPFLLNLLMAAGLLITADRLLARFELSAPARLLTLLAIIIFTPLTVVIYTGMEHVMHAWLVLVFLVYSVRLLQKPGIGIKEVLIASLLGALCVLARFESLFLLGGVFLLWAWYRRFWQAVLLMGFSLLPMALFGLWSMGQEGYFLPNSVLLKGSNVTGSMEQFKLGMKQIFIYKLIYGNNVQASAFNKLMDSEGSSSISGTSLVRLLIIVPVSLFLLKFGKTRNATDEQVKQLGLLFIIGGAAHLGLASVGWLFRYEAYLVLIAIFILGIVLYRSWPAIVAGVKERGLLEKFALLFLVLFTAGPLVFRTAGALLTLPTATMNIHEQQVQMGAFLNKYYKNTVVAANDVGAVSFFGHNEIMDLWGLGNNEVAKQKLKGQYSTEYLSQFVKDKQVQIALIYETWFEPGLYGNWKKVATWTIHNNKICGANDVSFFAVDHSRADELGRNLRDFQASLPPNVTVTYFQ